MNECLDACLSGNWDWCEWDADGDCAWDGQQWSCPRPEAIFICGVCYGCCEWRDSHSSQDGCSDFMDPEQCRQACMDGGYAWCRWTPDGFCSGGVCDGPFARVFFCRTVSADLACVPTVGTLPFVARLTVTLTNHYSGQIRRVAGVIDVRLANGTAFPNWRAGFTNIGASGAFTTIFTVNLPPLGSLVGDNTFTLAAEDVTDPPYNQPPYPPSGDTDAEYCIVTGR